MIKEMQKLSKKDSVYE